MAYKDESKLYTKNHRSNISARSTHPAAIETKASTRCSWAEEMCRADYHDQDDFQSQSRNSSMSTEDDKEKLHREIKLEFIEGLNEEKFERLVNQDKLKTPFKRRHESRPDSPNNSSSGGSSTNNSIASDGAGMCSGSVSGVTTSHSPVVEANGRNKNHNNNNNFFNRGGGEKRLRHNSYNSSTSSGSLAETNQAVLERRQKQIDYGKNTTAYERYMEQVPRQERTSDHPRTPNKHGKYSRRAFDGLIKIWRKQLHCYDEQSAATTTTTKARTFDDSSSSDSDE